MSKLSAKGLVLRSTLTALRPSALQAAAGFTTSVYKFRPLTTAQSRALLGSNQWIRFYSSDLPEHIKVSLPALSPTMEVGSIVAWAKREGEQVSEGDLLCEIETDKATMGFETPEEGYLAKILLAEGSRDVPIGKLLCIIVENEGDVSAFKDFKADESGGDAGAQQQQQKKDAVEPSKTEDAPAQEQPSSTSPPTPQPVTSAVPQSQSQPPKSPSMLDADRLKITPYAKKLVMEKGLGVETLKGSGPGGRILASDVLSGAAQSQQQQPESTPKAAAAGGSQREDAQHEDIQLTNMRRTIAKRLTESKSTIPHYYLTSEIAVDDLLRIREKLNAIVAQTSDPGEKPHRLSINDFIIKASALACQRVPEANSFFMDTFIRQNHAVDVSVAVSTDAGLITPIIFDAHTKGLLTISKETSELAKRAREGKLKPHEFQGGTFTVSNLGMFGSVDHFTAIINPPQSCILAIGGSKKRLVPTDDGPSVETAIKVTLSCDHRVVDGAVGARWLKQFKSYLEKPHTMLL